MKIDFAIYISLIAAIIAQIMNARYSNKRENKKVLQNISDHYIVPNISNILNFTSKISLNHHPEKSSLENLRTNVDPILKNIMYGDENLLHKRIEEDSKYNSLDAYDIEQQEYTRKLEIQLFFLIYSLKVLKKLKVKLHSNVGYGIEHSMRVHAYLIAARNLDKFEEGYNNLISITRFNFNSLSKISKSDIRKLKKNTWNEKVLNEIYNKVQNDFQKKFEQEYL